MRIPKATTFAALAAGVLALSVGTVYAAPHTHKVDCDKNGQTLQDRIDKAHIGDTIEVKGTCVENVLITTDQLVIDGGGTATVTPADDTVSTIAIRATNVRISGFSIVAGTTRQGVIVSNGGSAIISRNDISGTGASTGVLVTSSSYGRIGGSIAARGNTIHDHARGVNIRNSSGSDIFFNEIYDNVRGIQLSNNGAGDISDNLIRDNTNRGLSIITGGSVRLSSAPSSPGGPNVFNNNATGIRCLLGGSMSGNPQTFGVGALANGVDVSIPTSTNFTCHVSNSLGF